MIPFEAIGYAFLGGVIPAWIWLHFLLKEDSRCPEPRTLIVVAFIAGMAAVPIVLPLETFAAKLFPDQHQTILAWASIEEIVKYVLAALLVLWRKQVNESVDLVIYMLTVALGFAALENAFFLIEPFTNGQYLNGLATDNLRFVGSTLLHVVASSAIGFALAFTYRPFMSLGGYALRALATTIGLILAIALHAAFNFFILEQNGLHTLSAFFLVWTGAVVFFALFEILKYFRYRRLPANTC